jgi:hypothetical protein
MYSYDVICIDQLADQLTRYGGLTASSPPPRSRPPPLQVCRPLVLPLPLEAGVMNMTFSVMHECNQFEVWLLRGTFSKAVCSDFKSFLFSNYSVLKTKITQNS